MFEDPREPNPTEPRYAPDTRDTSDAHDAIEVLPADLGSMHDRLTDLAGHWAATLPSNSGLGAYARLLAHTDTLTSTERWDNTDDDVDTGDTFQITDLPPTSDGTRRIPFPAAHPRGWPVGAVLSAVLVVGLLAGLLVRFGPAQPASQDVPPLPTPCQVPTPAHPTLVNRSATVNGYTLTIDSASADATRTVVAYHVTPEQNIPALPERPFLLDSHGNRYAARSDEWTRDKGGLAEFAPLPPEQLGQPQTLTYFTQRLRGGADAPPTDMPSSGVGPSIGPLRDGPWQVSFSLTPAAGPSAALHCAAITIGPNPLPQLSPIRGAWTFPLPLT